MPSKYFAAAALVFLCAACTASSAGEPMDMASDPAVSDGSMAPMFEVDPFWPKPLPNHWLLGATIGVDVDSRARLERDDEFVGDFTRLDPDFFELGQALGWDDSNDRLFG